VTFLTRSLVGLIALTSASASIIPISGTGQNVSGGLDNSYRIISDSTGEITAPAQAFVVTTLPGAWATSIPGTGWIGPAANQASENPGNSSDTYQTSFSLAGLDPSTAILDFTMMVDNGVTVTLNGTTVYTNGNASSALFTAPFAGSITTGFIAGTNTLDFIVANAFGPTGIDISINGTASPVSTTAPEPGTWALVLVSGAAAIARTCFRRSGRRESCS
jgi:hypothetical protein